MFRLPSPLQGSIYGQFFLFLSIGGDSNDKQFPAQLETSKKVQPRPPPKSFRRNACFEIGIYIVVAPFSPGS